MMKDIPDLIIEMGRTHTILSEFVQSIPENRLDLRRGDGFWTIAEHVNHLAQVQPMLLDRIHRFLSETCPEFIPYFPGEDENESDTPTRMDMPVSLEQFAVCRSEQCSLIENADDGIWQRTAKHPEYEQYSLYILVRHILMHDYWHMYRMEELWLTKDAYLSRLE